MSLSRDQECAALLTLDWLSGYSEPPFCSEPRNVQICRDGVMIPPRPSVQVGTKRYLAPEVSWIFQYSQKDRLSQILNKTLDPTNFAHFKMADMYAFALVLWEVLTRVEVRELSFDYSNPRPPDSPLRVLLSSVSSSI